MMKEGPKCQLPFKAAKEHCTPFNGAHLQEKYQSCYLFVRAEKGYNIRTSG